MYVVKLLLILAGCLLLLRWTTGSWWMAVLLWLLYVGSGVYQGIQDERHQQKAQSWEEMLKDIRL